MDGDLDIATAGRLSAVGYGLPSPVAVYVNEGGGNFSLPTPTPESKRGTGGMVSGLATADLDLDGRIELIAVGEFMPITIYRSEGALFDRRDTITGSEGLYRSVVTADLDGDQRPEIIVGGFGDNTLFSTSSAAERLSLYFGDLDDNGQPEPIFTRRFQDREYPLALKSELQAIMPSIKKRFIRHSDYADKNAEEVFGAEVLAKAYTQHADHSSSQVFHYSTGERRWVGNKLPWQAQVSMVMALQPLDVDGDGDLDLLLAGNFYGTQARVGPMDASRGTLLINEAGTFVAKPSTNRINLPGQVRHLTKLKIAGGQEIIAVVRNSGQLQLIELSSNKPLQ